MTLRGPGRYPAVVLCAFLICSTCACLGGAPAPRMYYIRGTVRDATQSISDEDLAKLASAVSAKDVEQLLRGLFEPRPVPKARVTLRGDWVKRKGVTDSEGGFEFTGLPAGLYEMSAGMPFRALAAGARQTATANEHISLKADRHVDLQIRADLVTVRGRITDVHGQPIAGAKVTGIQEIVDPSSMHYPNTVSTVSGADGRYELEGLNPPDIWRIGGYLNGGDPTLDLHSFYLVVRAEASGFMQPEDSLPRLPLVTAERLHTVRRGIAAVSQTAVRLGFELGFSEKEGLPPFPSSHGNTITDIDIVLRAAVREATRDRPVTDRQQGQAANE